MGFNTPSADPKVDPENVGLLLKDMLFPFPSVRVSANVNPVKVTFPLFSTLIRYTTESPAPVFPSPLSDNVNVLVTSIVGEAVIFISVESSVVLPSVSSPSSLWSLTLFLFPGLEAVTEPVLETPPESTTA